MKTNKGYLFAIIAALFNATMALFAKLAVDVNTVTIVFFRNFICCITILLLILARKKNLVTKKIGLHLFRALFGLLSVYAYYHALKNLPLVNAIVLANTSALFIPLIVWVWLRVKVPLKRIVALMVGFIGVMILLNPDLGKFTQFESLIGLFAGFCIGVAMVGVRQLTKTESTETIIFYFFFIATMISFFPMIILWQPISLKMWGYILGTGISGTLFQLFLTKAFALAPVSKASSLLYMSVVFGGVYGYLVWGNLPSLFQITGAVLIIIGGILVLSEPRDFLRILGRKKQK